MAIEDLKTATETQENYYAVSQNRDHVIVLAFTHVDGFFKSSWQTYTTENLQK